MRDNKENHKTLASPSLVAFALFPWEIIIVLIIALLISGNILTSLICVVSLYIIISSIIGLIYRNAFSVVHIDEKGIRNRHTMLKWEEIDHANTVSVELRKSSLLPTIQIDILCFSKSNTKPSFFETNKDCIFIEATKKNIEIIESKVNFDLF